MRIAGRRRTALVFRSPIQQKHSGERLIVRTVRLLDLSNYALLKDNDHENLVVIVSYKRPFLVISSRFTLLWIVTHSCTHVST